MTAEPTRALNWLKTTLASAGAGGGVWEGIAPLSVTTTPYIVVQMQSAQDIEGVSGIRLWSRQTWQVKAVGPASDDTTLQTVADAIDTALQLATGAASDGTLIRRCVRLRPLAIPELQKDGTLWLNYGGIYQIDVQAA